MKRHILRMHAARQPIFANFAMNDQNKFKNQNSKHYNSHPRPQSSINIFDLPKSYRPNAPAFEQHSPAWLDWLRKFAEIKKLLRELSLPLAPESSSLTAFNGFFYGSKISLSPPKVDLKVIGYIGSICEKCLISFPITVYWHRASMKLIPAGHICSNERLFEVQQQQIANKKSVITTLLYELSDMMFNVVKKWTNGQPSLSATEIPSAMEGFRKFIIADRMEWALRAINDGFTTLTDEELVDFLNLAGNCTYACFKMAESKPNEASKNVYLMCITTAAIANST